MVLAAVLQVMAEQCQRAAAATDDDHTTTGFVINMRKYIVSNTPVDENSIKVCQRNMDHKILAQGHCFKISNFRGVSF